MPHSVRHHLHVEIDAYDTAIRRFIPGYDTMLRMAAGAIAAHSPALALDLGGGTGALSEAILSHDEACRLELIDIDPEMLGQARVRLERFGERVRCRQQSFHDALPLCDGIAASLALHHVPTLKEKRALYRHIYEALRPGGVFVNADAVMPADPAGQRAVYRFWADHMMANGIDEDQAFAHFGEWAGEDAYFPLEDEIEAMQAAGFTTECVWRKGPISILKGKK